MPIHITVDQAAERIAYQTMPEGLNDAQKGRLLPAKKYNVLINVFNGSSILLATAVLCTVVFAYTAAVAFGAIALFARFASEKELNKYTLPQEDVGGWSVRHLLGQVPQPEKEDNIFQKLNYGRPPNWVENEVYLFDYAVWKNKVPVPVG